MIEVHVVNALLLPELRTGDLFRFVNFINGLVAPSFIFIAGFAFAISTRRRWNDYTTLSKPLAVHLRRLAIILLIGYILHLPYFSFHKLMNHATPHDWEKFFQADVLHCIAFSLIFLQLLVLIFKNEKRTYGIAGAFGLIFVFGAPLAWMQDFSAVLPLPLATYMNNIHYSLFPLFPWSGFLMAGAVASYFFVKAVDDGKLGQFMKWAAIAGVVMVAGGVVFDLIPGSMYPKVDFWRTSPQFFFIRLGIVMLLLVGLWWGEQKFGYGGSFLTRFGQESLIVYATHLMVIYGSFLGDRSLATYVGRTQGWGTSLLVTAALIAGMIGLAYLWHWLKREKKVTTKIIQWSGSAMFLAAFFWREY